MNQPPTHAPDGPRFYRPELDVLRFLAFLLVYLRHIGSIGTHATVRALFLSGRAGVCLFFLLSSYLITTLLEREVDRTHTVDLRAFYLRRVLRIWPLYFFALLLARLIDWHAPHLAMSNGRLLASLLMAGNWYTYVFGLPASFALVLWSVSIEEQFYLLWPSVRRFMGRRALVVVSVLCLPVSYVSIAVLASRGRQDIQLWVNTFVQLQFFGLGGLLALVLGDRSPRLSPLVRLLLMTAGLFAMFASQQYVHNRTELPTVSSGLIEYLLMAFGSLLLFFSALGFAALRRASALIYLGKISYGLYVFQFLGIRSALRVADWCQHHASFTQDQVDLLTLALGLPITIVLAHLSYRYLETPFLRLKERYTTVRSREI